MTHQQLAIELGSAGEVIGRQLHEFQRRGWIKGGRGHIGLIDRKSLEILVAGCAFPSGFTTSILMGLSAAANQPDRRGERLISGHPARPAHGDMARQDYAQLGGRIFPLRSIFATSRIPVRPTCPSTQ